jgi:hypothetical protein
MCYAPIPVQNVLDRRNSTRVTRNSCAGQVLSIPLYDVGQTDPGGITEKCASYLYVYVTDRNSDF